MTRLFSLFALLLLLASCGKEEQKQPRDTEELPQITMTNLLARFCRPNPKSDYRTISLKICPAGK